MPGVGPAAAPCWQITLVGLWQKVAGKAPQTGKTTAALIILLAVILCSSFGVAPVELIATAGAT